MRLESVTKILGKTRAVHEVSLEVHRGEIFGLLGPNGAGKTTLLRMVAGMIRPTAGHVIVFGREAFSRDSEITRRTGFVMDKPVLEGLDRLNAIEYLKFFSRLYGQEPSSEEVELLLSDFGLGEYRLRQVGEYSRGMLQKISLARAVTHDPDLLLLDEPTSGLDPRAAIEFRDLLINLRDGGVTMVLSSHMLLDVQKLCSRLAIMNRGRVVYQGRMEECQQPTEAKIRLVLRTGQEERELLDSIKMVDAGTRLERRRSGRSVVVLVTVEDVDKGNALCKELVSRGLEVSEYQAINRSLEDIFASAVDGSSQRDAGS